MGIGYVCVNLSEEIPKKILVCPLDWGLGHATRCIPVIRLLRNDGHEIIIAADGKSAALLKQEFPDLTHIHLTGYRLSYSASMPAWQKIIFQIPKIISRIFIEHRDLKKLVAEHYPDAVVSDNRFGLWNKKIESVYITHQMMIKCPPRLKFFEPLCAALHRMIIKKYDQCWIPDFPGEENLSGDLSHKYSLPGNATFIGPLSRFSRSAENDFAYDVCCVISGPEPSRSEFEKIILSEFASFKGNAIVVLGKPEENRDETIGRMRIVSHLSSLELEKIIRASRKIICRPGYSSVMDLIAMKKNAVLIPTPGQTEQEYLAEYLTSKKYFYSVKESRFDLHALDDIDGISVMNFKTNASDHALKKVTETLKDLSEPLVA